nr:hypothetical protein [Tanacetum cinerariifolium]
VGIVTIGEVKVKSQKNPFFEGDGSSSNEQPNRPRQNQREDNRRWESEMRVNIPEVNGNTLNLEGFIDWLVVVKEVFEFKEVPENKRVLLIATKLRGRASAWWQQLKLTHKRIRKPRVASWRKIKKLMRENFIPHNYQRLIYQWLQNLKQETKSVKDYTTEFYQLISRNDIQETDDQLVSRYICSLRVQIMDSVNMFDPVTLSDAYQRPLAFEKQSRRVGSSSSVAITGGGSGSDKGVVDDEYEEPLVFDDDQYKEEIVSRDVGVNLMVRRFCLPPKAAGDDWIKHNIFQPACTIFGKVCTFVVDPRSYDNLIAEEAVQKLGLKTENRHKPYKLQWLKKGGEVTISKRVLVAFSMETTYKDSVWYDVVPIDACHLLLGRLGSMIATRHIKDELEMGNDIFMLIRKEVAKDSKIPVAMIPLLDKFYDVFLNELPDGMSLHEELHRQAEELVSKGHVRESMGPCTVPALLTPKKDGSWRMCVDSQAINKITMRYYQIRLRPGDEWKTAFKTREGLYEWLV